MPEHHIHCQVTSKSVSKWIDGCDNHFADCCTSWVIHMTPRISLMIQDIHLLISFHLNPTYAAIAVQSAAQVRQSPEQTLFE